MLVASMACVVARMRSRETTRQKFELALCKILAIFCAQRVVVGGLWSERFPPILLQDTKKMHAQRTREWRVTDTCYLEKAIGISP